MSKEIMIKIANIQVSKEADTEEMEFVTEAKLYRRNGAIYLLYEESEFSGMPGCKTRLRLRDDELQMKRFLEDGEIGTELIFQKGKKHEELYETPFGPIEIELLTNDIAHDISEDGKGEIDIDYEISLRGLAESRNRMHITLM